MRVYSPAKINLHLAVGPVLPNGFHPLVSWMVTVGLFDTLDFSLDTAGRATLRCPDPAVPCDESNLIVRAARALQAAARASGGETLAVWNPRDADALGVDVRLIKQIPMGGGLGGGSSNAATTLLALNDLWKLSLPRHRLTEIAATLGSDVPFFLNGPSSICTGRGEIIQPIDPPRVRWVVLILPEMSMPTPAVYRQFDAMGGSRTGWDRAVNATDEVAQWNNLSAEDLLQRLVNDLEPPAYSIRPDLERLAQAAQAIVARPVRMSGSGSTHFTLFDSRVEADQAAKEILQRLSLRTVVCSIAPEIADG